MNRSMKVTVAAGMLLQSASGLANPSVGQAPPPASVLPFAVEPMPLLQRCWLDHTQVQPVPMKLGYAAGNLAVGGPKVWNQPGSRPGSEHWNVEELRRACQSSLTRQITISNALDDFPDSR